MNVLFLAWSLVFGLPGPGPAELDGSELEFGVFLFGFSPEVQDDILFVANETGNDPLLIASVVDRESNGNYGVVSYCVKWKKHSKKPKCLKQKTCWSDCRSKRSVWKNRLDLGLWQLRDAPTWSWIRWYRKTTGEKITSECALDRFCSRKVMIAVVNHLQTVEPRDCGEASDCAYDFAWLSRWNGCASCANHVRVAMGKRLLLHLLLSDGGPFVF